MAKFRGAWLVVFCFLVLATSQAVEAQTSPSAMLDQYRAVRVTWLNTAAVYANSLFGILAVIEFAWTAAILVLERTDLQGWTAALIRKMMFIGAFFALLNFGADWIPRIINSFQIIGQTASGMPALRPTDVLTQGLNISGNLLNGASNSGWMGNIGSALSLVFASLLAFLAFLGLTVQLVVTLVESYLVVGAAFIFLGFGGSRWTAPYVERYIALAVATGVKVMVLYLLLGAGLSLTNDWAAAAQAVPDSADPAVDALDIAASSVLLLMICWNAPKFTAAILGGSPAFTGGDAVGSAGALIQGVLLAGAAVSGGLAHGSKALAARDGMPVGQAASAGSSGSSSSKDGGSGGGGGPSGGSSPSPPGKGIGSSGETAGGGQVSPPARSGTNSSNPANPNPPTKSSGDSSGTSISTTSRNDGTPQSPAALGTPLVAETSHQPPNQVSPTIAGSSAETGVAESPAQDATPASTSRVAASESSGSSTTSDEVSSVGSGASGVTGPTKTGDQNAAPSPAPEGDKPSIVAKVGEASEALSKGLARTAAFAKATQGAIPPDHAPHAAPPPLKTEGEGSE